MDWKGSGGSPVKFASLLIFDKFNRASRVLGSTFGVQGYWFKVLGSEVLGWLSRRDTEFFEN
jgi:hypothetical protein